MIFRDEKNARQMLSAEEPAAKPVGFGLEAFNSAWDAVRREEQSVSMDRAFGDRFGSYIDEVERITGTRLKNPIQPRSNFSPADLLFHGGKRGARESDYNGFLDQVNELRASRDDIPEPPEPNAMLEEIIAEYDVKRREHQDLRSRQTAGGAFADFLGSAVGAIEDPVVLATLPFGASAGAGILRTALTEAGISMAVDAPIQFGAVSETKEVLGVEFGVADAASNILMTGALAGGAGAAVAGAVKGAKALSSRRQALSSGEPEVRRRRPASATEGDLPSVQAEEGTPSPAIASDRKVLEEYKAKVESGEVKETPATRRAAADLERDIEIADTNPSAEKSVEGGIEHEENFNKAYEALQRGTPMSVPVRGLDEQKVDVVYEQPERQFKQTRGGGVRFHGTGAQISALSEYTYSSTNYFGQGFYTTDAIDVAAGYSKSKRTGGGNFVYRVSEKSPATTKFADLEIIHYSDFRSELDEMVEEGIFDEAFIDEWRDDNWTMRQIYDDIRNAFLSADEIQVMYEALAENLWLKNNFNSIKHKGGRLTGSEEHEVLIYLNPKEDLQIEPIDLKDFESQPVKKAVMASSGDDIISEIMTETQLPKAIQARFHETMSEIRTQVSLTAPGSFGRADEYARLVERQDELLRTPRTKKNRAKLNKEIAQIAGQLDEINQPRVVASASRDKSVDEYWNVDRPADDIAEEEADQVLKADLERAIEEHGEDFQIPISETIDEATGGRAAQTTSLRQLVMELDEADKVADEFANCLLSAAEAAS